MFFAQYKNKMVLRSLVGDYKSVVKKFARIRFITQKKDKIQGLPPPKEGEEQIKDVQQIFYVQHTDIGGSKIRTIDLHAGTKDPFSTIYENRSGKILNMTKVDETHILVVDEQLNVKTFEVRYDALKKKSVLNEKITWDFMSTDKEFIMKNKYLIFHDFARMHVSANNTIHIGKYFFSIYEDQQKLANAELEDDLFPKRFFHINEDHEDNKLIDGPLVSSNSPNTMLNISV